MVLVDTARKGEAMRLRDDCHGGIAVEDVCFADHLLEKPHKRRDDLMVSRIGRTPTVQERAAAFEHTNKVAQETAKEERLLLEEKSAKLRALRLAAANGTSAE